MVINNEEDAVILCTDGLRIILDKDLCKKIKEKYETYYESEIQEDNLDTEILQIVKKYLQKHKLGIVIGEEYVANNPKAKEDSSKMFSEILEICMLSQKGDEKNG